LPPLADWVSPRALVIAAAELTAAVFALLRATVVAGRR
jgi:hypothetical protein